MVEVSAVVDAGLLARRTAKHLRPPRVEMAVEVDDADGTVGAVDAAEQGERDGVVASEGDDSWESLAVLGRAGLVGVGVRFAAEDAVVAFFDLVEGVGIV